MLNSIKRNKQKSAIPREYLAFFSIVVTICGIFVTIYFSGWSISQKDLKFLASDAAREQRIDQAFGKLEEIFESHALYHTARGDDHALTLNGCNLSHKFFGRKWPLYSVYTIRDDIPLDQLSTKNLSLTSENLPDSGYLAHLWLTFDSNRIRRFYNGHYFSSSKGFIFSFADKDAAENFSNEIFALSEVCNAPSVVLK